MAAKAQPGAAAWGGGDTRATPASCTREVLAGGSGCKSASGDLRVRSMPEALREGIKGGKPQTKSNFNVQNMTLMLRQCTVLGD